MRLRSCTGAAGDRAVGAAEEVLFDGHDLADRPVVNPPHRFLVAGLVPAVQAGHHAEPFLLGQLAGGRDHVHAGRVDGVRLFHEHVLAGLDRRQHVHGVELGGAGDEHHVERFDHLAIAVQPGEAMGVVDLHLLGLLLLEHLAPALHAVGEDVGHGHQPHARIAIHGLQGRARAAAAAAHHADLDDSLPAAWTLRASARSPNAAAETAAAEVFKKVRREGRFGVGRFLAAWAFSFSNREGRLAAVGLRSERQHRPMLTQRHGPFQFAGGRAVRKPAQAEPRYLSFFSKVAFLPGGEPRDPVAGQPLLGLGVVAEIRIPEGRRHRADQVLKQGGVFNAVPEPGRGATCRCGRRGRPEKIMWSPPLKITKYWSARCM